MPQGPRAAQRIDAAYKPGTVAAGDLVAGLMQYQLWGRLGWLEVKRRYRRTVIGPFWSAMSLAIFIGALGLVGANLWRQNIADFLPFLTAGMVVWALISASLSEACTVFLNYTSILHQVRFNYSVLVYALIWRGLVIFLHNFVVYIAVILLIDPGRIGWVAILAIPGLLVVAINIAWLALLVGMACLRYRDLQQIVMSVIQLSLFVTPIFWLPSQMTGAAHMAFVTLNPLWHLISLVREPLLGQFPAGGSYAAGIGMAITGWLLASMMFVRYRARLVYWT